MKPHRNPNYKHFLTIIIIIIIIGLLAPGQLSVGSSTLSRWKTTGCETLNAQNQNNELEEVKTPSWI